MKNDRTVWSIRLAGLVLSALFIAALYKNVFLAWLGHAALSGSHPDDIVRLGLIAAVAVSLRLTVFGASTLARVGIVLLVFCALLALTVAQPKPLGNTDSYYEVGVGFYVFLFVYPAALGSLVLAAVPLFDKKLLKRIETPE